MGVPRRLKTVLDPTLEHIAKRLRRESEDVTREALPERWAELILYLDEQEKKRNEVRQAQAESPNRPEDGSAAA